VKQAHSYSTVSKTIHWTLALIIILMLSLSFFLGDVAKPNQPLAYMIHKSFGLLVLGLMVVRLFWIYLRGKPPLPMTVPQWQQWLARGVQYFLYFFLFLMPITGLIMSVAADHPPFFFGLFKVSLPIAPNENLAEFMAGAHEIIAWILIGLLVLHISGAMKHYFVDKDKVLQTMLPGKH
jgi:cytochrome b561